MLTLRPTFVVPVTARGLDILLECLTLLNVHWIHAHPTTPELYQSGVIYRAEPKGAEEWLTIPYVLAAGCGDCEDLAAYRAAELRVRSGIVARAFASRVETPDGSVQFHARVRLGNGQIEDPSKVLGM